VRSLNQVVQVRVAMGGWRALRLCVGMRRVYQPTDVHGSELPPSTSPGAPGADGQGISRAGARTSPRPARTADAAWDSSVPARLGSCGRRSRIRRGRRGVGQGADVHDRDATRPTLFHFTDDVLWIARCDLLCDAIHHVVQCFQHDGSDQSRIAFRLDQGVEDAISAEHLQPHVRDLVP
jgi:hypothetical protein